MFLRELFLHMYAARLYVTSVSCIMSRGTSHRAIVLHQLQSINCDTYVTDHLVTRLVHYCLCLLIMSTPSSA